jgi:predicted nucleotidyltransferase
MTSNPLFASIQTYLRAKNIRRAAVFGSFARGEETEQSDLDLLIEAEGLTLFDVLQMEEDLGRLTNRKIDIVEYRAVKPALQKHVFAKTVELV